MKIYQSKILSNIAGIYLLKVNKVRNMLKVNNKDTSSRVFIVNFELISYLVLVFLLTLNM